MTPTRTASAASGGEANVYQLVRPRTILYAALIALVGAIMLYTLTTRTHIAPERAARARADVHADRTRASCATATRCASPTSGASRASSRSSVSGVTGATDEERRGQARSTDGRLTVSVDPDATLEVPVYVTAPPDVDRRRKSTPITITATDPKTGERSVVGRQFLRPVREPSCDCEDG